MKKLFLLATALFYIGFASAQINTVWVNTSGDVKLRQGNAFSCSGGPYTTTDTVLYLQGSKDYEVTVENLRYLHVLSSGDVTTENMFHGNDLVINFNSSGDTRLDLNYDYISVMMVGSGDLVLRGHCDVLEAKHSGSGDLNTKGLARASEKGTVEGGRAVPNLAGLSELLAELGTNLEQLADSVDWQSFEADMERWGQSMEEWGRHMEEWGERVEREMDQQDRDKERWGKGKPDYVPQPNVKVEHGNDKGREAKPEKRSLLYDPQWSGFEAGLNLLLGPGSSSNFEGPYLFLEQKPMKSWVFNFNIADVGIAFNRKHVGGLYTGIGLGWNNYSFNNPVRLYKSDNNRLEGEWIDEQVEGKVKKSKLGVLYVQAPLMIEVRPTRHFHIAAGVVGGVRVDAWTKVKFVDKSKEKYHGDYYVNLFKLDAMLRAGGEDMGFFASYNLLPLFYEPNGPTSHTLCFGFSLLF
jgi:hypothetical protein